jgi:5'-nucleotidase
MRTKLYKIIVLIIISTVLNKIAISCKEKNNAIKMIRGTQLEITDELELDEDIRKAIEPYEKELENKVNEVLCFNPTILSRDESALESSLGNFYADVCYQTADRIFFPEAKEHIDFALFNYGGIRTAIPQGEVRVEHIFKLMPFENKLVVARLSGEKVRELFQFLEKSKQAHPISGLNLSMTDDRLSRILISGKTFDASKEYLVLTHDYLQHGGDNMSFFKDPIALYPLSYKVRDALIDHLRSIDTLQASIDGRFIQINESQ